MNLHPLKQYRLANDITLDALAAKVGATKATLSRIENWLNVPSFALAGRIKAATKGIITPNDFLMPEKKQRRAS